MFIPGKIYIRKEIHDTYGGQRQGGISTLARFPAILIFTGDSGENYGYKDEWKSNDVFIYTGEGQIGDMEFVRGNKAIRDQKTNNKEIYLFKKLGQGKVQYISKMELVKYYYEQGFDLKDNKRKIIRFELKKTV